MKKGIKTVLVVVALTTFGCNGKETSPAKSTARIENEQQLLADYKKEKDARKTTCADLVVIDTDKIDPSQLQQWITANTPYECTDKPIPATVNCPPENNCSSNVYFIDLALIKDLVNPSPKNDRIKKAEWLQQNGPFICFAETTPHIQNRHNITSLYVRAVMELSKSYMLTFKEFKDEVNKSGVTNYDTDIYNYYLILSISGGNVLITPSKTYEPNYVCYSIPFFRSIEQAECLKDDDKIYFIPIEIGGVAAMAFKIKTTSGTSLYFDYSDEPKFNNNFY